MKNLPEKLYVQYMPDAAACRLLLKLQSEIKQDTASGRLVPTDQLHVTVLHFGFIQQAYKQLLNLQPMLRWPQYSFALQTFIHDIKPELPATCELTIDGLAHFGPNGSVIAVTLKEDLALIKAYEQTMKHLRRFAEAIGINAVADIPSQPRALQVPIALKPHISLLKVVPDRRLDDPVVPYKGTKLTFNLYPLE